MPRYFQATPAASAGSNLRLRADAIYIYYNDNTVTPAGLRQWLGSTFWFSGTSLWQATPISSTSTAILGDTGSKLAVPIFSFTSSATSITDTATAFNYNSWAIGDNIGGWNNYGADYIGTASTTTISTSSLGNNAFKGYYSPFRTWTVRQLVYNGTRGELALRASCTGGTPTKAGLSYLMLFSGTTVQTSPLYSYDPVNATFYTYTVGSDTTGVWVWTGASNVPSVCSIWPDFSS